MRPPRLDRDAALWLAVAFFAAAFGILPVLLAGLAVKGSALDGVAYYAANAVVVGLAFATVGALLVLADPARRMRDLAFTLWVVGVAATGALAVLRLIEAPRAAFATVLSMVAPLTFGFVQLDSLSPLRLAPPDPWALAGVLVGALLARAVLRLRGRKVGVAAEHGVVPMRLPGSGAHRDHPDR